MKINNNISAVITNKHLLRNEGTLSTSMERLSSGFKINSGKDDPSGLAISNKMKAQIMGLDRASQNSQDGTSVLETADGALGELQSILQRMRELSVQAANDTNSTLDREHIQDEIEQLKEEVSRISNSTEFNTKKLLDGSLDTQVYAEGVSRMQVSNSVEAGKYEFRVNAAATRGVQAVNLPPALGAGGVTAAQAGQVIVNGFPMDITEGMTADEVTEAVRKAAEYGNAELSADGTKVQASIYGKDGYVKIQTTNADLAALIGITPDSIDPETGYVSTDENIGVSTDLDLITGINSAFRAHPQATYKLEGTANGERLIITDRGGFEMSMLIAPYMETTDPNYTESGTGGYIGSRTAEWDEQTGTGTVTLDVTDKGPMDIQIGANEHQQVAVKVPATDAERLYIDDLNVAKKGGADVAIARLDEAIEQVSAVRSAIGAYSNRLEYAKTSLDATSENITAAVSRIQDTDMAKEMTEFTKDNVLVQAATSALSQANEIPQTALQLLG